MNLVNELRGLIENLKPKHSVDEFLNLNEAFVVQDWADEINSLKGVSIFKMNLSSRVPNFKVKHKGQEIASVWVDDERKTGTVSLNTKGVLGKTDVLDSLRSDGITSSAKVKNVEEVRRIILAIIDVL